jgi:hypothetical protein
MNNISSGFSIEDMYIAYLKTGQGESPIGPKEIERANRASLMGIFWGEEKMSMNRHLIKDLKDRFGMIGSRIKATHNVCPQSNNCDFREYSQIIDTRISELSKILMHQTEIKMQIKSLNLRLDYLLNWAEIEAITAPVFNVSQELIDKHMRNRLDMENINATNSLADKIDKISEKIDKVADSFLDIARRNASK